MNVTKMQAKNFPLTFLPRKIILVKLKSLCDKTNQNFGQKFELA